MTRKHKIAENMEIKKPPKLATAKTYICNYCSYSTNRKTDWNEHINTKKHSKRLIDKIDVT